MSSNSKALSQRFRRFLPVVVDVETAGMNHQHAPIVEIALTFLKMDDEELQIDDYLHFHIQPFEGSIIEASCLEYIGYDLDKFASQQKEEKDAFAIICEKVKERVKAAHCTQAIMVGHNAHFDLGFINTAIKRCNLKSPFHSFSTLDTVSLSALMLGHTVLCQCCQLAGMEWDKEQAHSAWYDCRKTALLFCQLVNQAKGIYDNNTQANKSGDEN